MRRRSFLQALIGTVCALLTPLGRLLKPRPPPVPAWLQQGYIYAPYIPFYTTPTIVLEDWVPLLRVETRWVRGTLIPRDSKRRQLRLSSIDLPVSLDEFAGTRPVGRAEHRRRSIVRKGDRRIPTLKYRRPWAWSMPRTKSEMYWPAATNGKTRYRLLPP